jgi:hypothetical protein
MVRSIIVGLFLFALLLLPSTVSAHPVNCSAFRYQEDAQADFNSNPAGHRNLDRDRDGLACETLPRRPGAAAPRPAPAERPVPTRRAPVTQPARPASTPARVVSRPAPARQAAAAPTRRPAAQVPARMPDTGSSESYVPMALLALGLAGVGLVTRRAARH